MEVHPSIMEARWIPILRSCGKHHRPHPAEVLEFSFHCGWKKRISSSSLEWDQVCVQGYASLLVFFRSRCTRNSLFSYFLLLFPAFLPLPFFYYLLTHYPLYKSVYFLKDISEILEWHSPLDIATQCPIPFVRFKIRTQ